MRKLALKVSNMRPASRTRLKKRRAAMQSKVQYVSAQQVLYFAQDNLRCCYNC